MSSYTEKQRRDKLIEDMLTFYGLNDVIINRRSFISDNMSAYKRKGKSKIRNKIRNKGRF